ncbi:MFS transporter [Novosphingobium sp. BL-8H]|uniref:MFS transporter n=1 Tax=Novosphingobium sp. BL-8H TaxID=3127640 RepID=UPI003757EA70
MSTTALHEPAVLLRPPTQQMSDKQRRFITKLTVLISGGMFIDGFILGGIGILMPSITQDLNLSLAWQGLIGASALIGIFLGGPLGGYLADKIGRKPMFTIDLAIFLVGSIAQFFVTDPMQLFVVRVLMGVAIGADYAVGWPMLAEFAPARLRGFLMSVQEVGWYAGYLIAYVAGWALVVSHIASWNVILGLSAVPTLIVLLMRLGTPESPRWLKSQGRTAEAEELAREYMCDEGRKDLKAQDTSGSLKMGHLFSSHYIKTTIFVSVFWVCNVTPYFAISTFAPFVLNHLGLGDGLAGGIALNGLALVGVVTATLLVEKMGRRKLGIPPFFISAAVLVAVALLAHLSAMIIVVCVLLFAFVNAVSTTLCSVYPGEVFPTEIRGAGVGFATAVSRIGAAAGTFLMPLSIDHLGISGTMMIAAGISLFGGVVSWLLAPETMGKQLSETSAPTSGNRPNGC